MTTVSAAAPSLKQASSRLLHTLMAGAICALVSLVFSLSYGALIFSGPLTPWVAYGLATTFLTTAVGALVVASRSSLPFVLGGPDASTTAIVAALTANLVGHLVAEGARDHVLGPALIVIAASGALVGLTLCALGIARVGRAVRFVPFPVMGGFLAATGWLIATGAIQVITGHGVRLTELEAFLDLATLAKFGAGAAVTVALMFGRIRFKGPFAQPTQLLLCAAAVYAAFALLGISLPQAQADGWMFQQSASATFSPPWSLQEWRNFPWHLLPSLGADFLTLMFVAPVSILLNLAGSEVLAKHEANHNRDLTTVGMANILSASLGGYVIGIPMSRSTLAFKLAGNSRIPTLCVAASSAAMLAVDPFFLGYIPKAVVGGLLLLLGIDLLYRWLVQSARQLASVDYVSLILITLIIIKWGFIAGILMGIVISCATFAFGVSKVNPIKFSFDGTEYRSTLDRGPKELALLARHGTELQGMSLQSYIFFGSADKLYESVKMLLVARPECRHLIFDFRSVIGVDSSAAHSFTQIKQALERHGARLIFVNVSPEVTHSLRMASGGVLVEDNLDRALEACENAIIKTHQTEESESVSLRAWLADALGSLNYADLLASQCKRVEVKAGDIVARQGDAANSMHFILDGRVDIIANVDGARSVRVRSLGRYTSIGEMGLITARPRSATIQAAVPSVLYVLSADAFNRIREDNPLLGQALLTYVVDIMAERLSYASRAIGLLQR